jgi:hypothetical protein
MPKKTQDVSALKQSLLPINDQDSGKIHNSKRATQCKYDQLPVKNWDYFTILWKEKITPLIISFKYKSTHRSLARICKDLSFLQRVAESAIYAKEVVYTYFPI